MIANDKTRFLSESLFEYETINIGMFHERHSKYRPENIRVLIEHQIIVYKRKSEYVLVNDCDHEIEETLNGIKKNYKVLVAIIIESNRTFEEIKDFYKLKTLKYLSDKIKFRVVFEEITSHNKALNILCKNKIKQLGYINKLFCNNEISSQKLSHINKDIDFHLCKDLFHDNDIVSFDQISYLFLKSKLIRNSSSSHLFTTISILLRTKVTSIIDISNAITYLKKNQKINIEVLNEFETLIFSINRKIKKEFLLNDLIFEIEKIEKIRNKEKNPDRYNFIKNSLLDKSKKTKIIDFFTERL